MGKIHFPVPSSNQIACANCFNHFYPTILEETMKKLAVSVFQSAVLWGGFLSFLFYYAMHRGLIGNELIIRYTSQHPIEHITVSMFFIGMVHLFFHYIKLGRERRGVQFGLIFSPIGQKEDLGRIDLYLDTLQKAEKVRGGCSFIERLKKGLIFLKNGGSPNELDQELRYLAEEDSFQSESKYGMVRMFIWAIPILGFLGTVIGITMALGNLNLTELETTGKLLAAGLQVAFDTTALALSLVFILYFSLFYVRGRESQIFHQLDKMAEKELSGRFSGGASNGSQDAELTRRILGTMVDSIELLIQKQTELWKEALRQSEERSSQIALAGSKQIDAVLSHSLKANMELYSQKIVEGEERLIARTITPLIEALEKKTEKLGAFKDQMIQEENILLEVLQATGEITRLEDRLNHNLNALAGVGCFEETVNSLAATIHLLNTKLTAFPAHGSEIRLAASPEIPATRGNGKSVVIPIGTRSDTIVDDPKDF
ncbi:MAG: MotA/TolQ/ExbB proton channel family protein [Planctomycetia bacterium]|nr:MotA/TolQ/ExbB proton channel family protein [Planctomycetia bacterium]